MIDWLIRLGDATSQLFNVLLFAGDPNYSISGDAYRYNRVVLRTVLDFVFLPLESDHCRRAYEHDVAKARRLIAETEV